MREDELEVVPLLQLALSSGTFDLAWLTRLGRAHADGLRLLATAWTEAYQARFEGPALESGADQRTAMELAAQLGGDFLPLGDPALLGIYRRQQELAWTEHLVERIENELEAAGTLGRPERVPAMSFLDLTGYTQLTEQQGDTTAAALAETLAVLVNRSSHEHGGVPVKWLGDGVMIHHREPAGAVLSALGLVDQLPEAGLPAGPCRGGGRAGGRPGRRLLRPHRQPRRPDRRPRQRRARSWSASAWPTRPHPRACASSSRGSYHSRGSPVRCGCWRPVGRELLTPQYRQAAGPAGPLQDGPGRAGPGARLQVAPVRRPGLGRRCGRGRAGGGRGPHVLGEDADADQAGRDALQDRVAAQGPQDQRALGGHPAGQQRRQEAVLDGALPPLDDHGGQKPAELDPGEVPRGQGAVAQRPDEQAGWRRPRRRGRPG